MDLFSKTLKRMEILQARESYTDNLKEIVVNIHRNHAFEPISSIISPFLAYSKLKATFNIGNYDDSLSFNNHRRSNLEILWVDLSRYKSDPSSHIINQVSYLQSLSTSPILCVFMDIGCYFSKPQLPKETKTIFLSSFLSPKDLDDTKSPITGTRLGNQACIAIAQLLGLKTIPSLILPALKAIVLDLDNTLYQGILGEDGIENIILTKEHIKLHEKILTYKKNGFLLALASKNEERDAEELFKKRADFLLKWEHFDLKKINWRPKIENLQEIAKEFNIGLDSILFIDDNIAEVESIKPLGVKNILATSAQKVLDTLDLFPQMEKDLITKEDQLRSEDIRANQIRKELEELPQEEYFKNLQISLEFNINRTADTTRITELLNKTNQFISNYTRPTLHQVNSWFKDPSMAIITISMSDKLSDSGIIAILVAKKNNHSFSILDLCISCRALGRKLEEIMLFYSLDLLKERFQIKNDTILIHFQKGERNQPFLEFLSKITNKEITPPLAEVLLKKVKTTGLNIRNES